MKQGRNLGLALLTAWGLSLLMPGCGNSNSNSNSFFTSGVGQGGAAQQPQFVSGKVTLPTGLNLPLSTLTLFTASGQSQVGADGTFQVPVPAGGPIFTMVSGPDEKTILIGFIQAGAANLDARSTATALYFLALQCHTLARDQWAALLNLIAADQGTTTLTQAVVDALQRNPAGLNDGDDAFIQTLRQVLQDLAQRGQTSPRAFQPALFREINSISVAPTTAQNLVNLASDNQKVQATNVSRLSSMVYVFLKREVQDDERVLDHNPYLRRSNRILIGGVNGLTSVVGGLTSLGVALATNSPSAFVYQPNVAELSGLELREGIREANYQAVLISPSLKDGEAPIWISDASHYSAGDQQLLDSERGKVMVYEFLNSLLFPLLNLGLSGLAEFRAGGVDDTVSEFISLDLAFATTAIGVEQGSVNSWQNGLVNVLTAMAQSPGLITRVLQGFAPSVAEGAAGALLTKLSKFNTAVRVLDLSLGSTDLFITSAQYTSLRPTVAWDLKVEGTSTPTPTPTPTPTGQPGVITTNRRFVGTYNAVPASNCSGASNTPYGGAIRVIFNTQANGTQRKVALQPNFSSEFGYEFLGDNGSGQTQCFSVIAPVGAFVTPSLNIVSGAFPLPDGTTQDGTPIIGSLPASTGGTNLNQVVQIVLSSQGTVVNGEMVVVASGPFTSGEIFRVTFTGTAQ